MNVKLTPFIMLDGQASEAIPFYEQALGAQVVFRQTFGEIPQEGHPWTMTEELKERIAHCVLVAGGTELFVCDSEPNQQLERGDQVNICLTVKDASEAERLFDALRSDGKVLMPLQPVYFSPAFGMVTDRFGVTFQVFTDTK